MVISHLMYRYESGAPSTGLVSNELRFLFCGTLECDQDLRLGPAVWEHWKLGFVDSGRGTLRVGGSDHDLGPGDCFLIAPSELAAYRPVSGTAWSYYWVAFDGLNVADLVRRTAFKDSPVIRSLPKESLFSSFQGMIEASQVPTSGDLRLLAELYRLFALLTDLAPPAAPSRLRNASPDYSTAAVNWLSIHYSRAVSIADLARHLGLHGRYFSRIFRRKTGRTPQDFLTELRVRKAQELLATGQLTVAEVARSVGYQDPFVFSKMFRSRCGVPPSAWGRTPLLLG